MELGAYPEQTSTAISDQTHSLHPENFLVARESLALLHDYV